MKKVTESCLIKILSYLVFCHKSEIGDEEFSVVLADLESFIRSLKEEWPPVLPAEDIIFSGHSDTSVLRIVLKEKIITLLLTLLNSSEKNLDKKNLESFFLRLKSL